MSSLLFFLVFLFASCQANPSLQETSLPVDIPPPIDVPLVINSGSGGITDEIRFKTELGSPSSLLNSLEIIRDRKLESTEFGRLMVNVNVTLLKTLYPAIQAQLPLVDPPISHIYSRIIREAERGEYTTPRRNSMDYLEHVLPFLSIYPEHGRRGFPAERYLLALPDLDRAVKLNGESVLARYFLGIANEQLKRFDAAYMLYSIIWEEFPECFIAALGLVRVMEAQGQKQEAENFLSDLIERFSGNFQVRRQAALSYYNSGDWSRADTAVDDILRINNRDRDFVLMKAHILIEQGHLFQALYFLDMYAGMDPNNKLYLFLQARVQAEAYNNREGALNYLRSILRSSPSADSAEDPVMWISAAVFASRLLMESNRPQDQVEGRDFLVRLLAVPEPPLEVVSLALRDAIRREAWAEARRYLTRLLDERRSSQDLLAAYTVEKEQGNASAALSYARELYERDRTSDEGIIAYISALIDTGRREEAARMVETRLNSLAGGVLKSSYFFLRSQTRRDEELMLSDLRASLFEDPRNLNALIATFEIYHQQGEERRAVYYLRQALALAPDNLRLKRYEAEYAAAMRGGF